MEAVALARQSVWLSRLLVISGSELGRKDRRYLRDVLQGAT